MKYCPRCKTEKEVELFNKGNSSQGRAGYCKKCSSDFKKEKSNGKPYYGQNAQTRKNYLEKNAERLEENRKAYYQDNKEVILARGKSDYIRRRDSGELRVYNNKYFKMKRDTDPMFKLKANLRSRIHYILKKEGFIKEKTLVLVGATIEVVKKHIERQFKKGMCWENYGQWEVDHKIPLASAKNEEELKLLFHYRNIQPLWSSDNRSKNDSILPFQLSIAI